METLIKCSACGLLKDRSFFPKKRIKKRGWCRKCASKRTLEWKHKNRDHVNAQARLLRKKRTDPQKEADRILRKKWKQKNKEKIQEQAKEYRERQKKTQPKRLALARVKHKAKRLGYPFNIDESDIIIPKKCPLLGIKIKNNGLKNNRASSFSIDRIKPSLGYIKGNVRVISFRANMIKNNATPEELKTIASNIDKYVGGDG